jgi:YfiH family protein
MLTRSPEGVYTSTLVGGLPFVRHGFATRNTPGWPGKYARVRQIHSNIVAVAEAATTTPAQADAVVTAEPDHWVGIRTADCVPLLIADRRGRAVAAVHAGWRGTVADIAGETVRRLKDLYGCSPEDLVVAIGPCIARCCFEVGPEVGERFRPLFGDGADLTRIDLAEANRRQLTAAGLPHESIDVTTLCTACDGGEFHSYRRDRELSGRMVAAIALARRGDKRG